MKEFGKKLVILASAVSNGVSIVVLAIAPALLDRAVHPVETWKDFRPSDKSTT